MGKDVGETENALDVEANRELDKDDKGVPFRREIKSPWLFWGISPMSPLLEGFVSSSEWFIWPCPFPDPPPMPMLPIASMDNWEASMSCLLYTSRCV